MCDYNPYICIIPIKHIPLQYSKLTTNKFSRFQDLAASQTLQIVVSEILVPAWVYLSGVPIITGLAFGMLKYFP